MISIVIIGVGGQGTLLASRILGQYALKCGMDVKVSEVHGMAQRGGSVATFVRMGERVYSPLVEFGGADYVLAFERLEAARALTYLKPSGVMLLNVQKILPMPVVTGQADYPENIIEDLSRERETIAIDAQTIAINAGSARAANVALIGALAKRMGGEIDLWMDALSACVPKETLAVNNAAFMGGYEA